MARTLGARLAFAAAATFIALVGSATRSVVAAPPTEPPVTMVFPAGVACAGFDLAIQISDNSNRVFKEFKDKNGTVVRILTAGKGSTLVFTNQLTNLSLFVKPNGSVEHRTLNADGSQNWVITGHNVLILFPTDVPPGPSTTQYVGRVVFTVDPTGVFTLQSVSGTSTNICAALT